MSGFDAKSELTRIVGEAMQRERAHFERTFNSFEGLGWHTDAELAEMYASLKVVLIHLRMLSELG